MAIDFSCLLAKYWCFFGCRSTKNWLGNRCLFQLALKPPWTKVDMKRMVIKNWILLRSEAEQTKVLWFQGERSLYIHKCFTCSTKHHIRFYHVVHTEPVVYRGIVFFFFFALTRAAHNMLLWWHIFKLPPWLLPDAHHQLHFTWSQPFTLSVAHCIVCVCVCVCVSRCLRAVLSQTQALRGWVIQEGERSWEAHKRSDCQNCDFPPGTLSSLGPAAHNWWRCSTCVWVCLCLSVRL